MKRFIPVVFSIFILTGGASAEDLRQKAIKDYKDGNYQLALEKFKELCLNVATDPRKVGSDLRMGLQCLASLNQAADMDAFREKVILVQKDNWRLLLAAAQSYMSYQHYGYLVADEFHRGHHRGGGRYVSSQMRDQTRALQLMQQALQAAREESNAYERANFYLAFADMWVQSRGAGASWRLQYLTDLSQLPDYDAAGGEYRDQTLGAPVDEENQPRFYGIPKSWETAESDGERWRWLLSQAIAAEPHTRVEVLRRLARFHYDQFGVHTLTGGGFRPAEDTAETQAGIFALATLKENETIARLATGIKRFELPDEFNFIRMFKAIDEYHVLARIFENRQQYDKAAFYWEKAGYKDKVEQITGNWGVFEPVATQPAGKGATVDYRFRNGNSVTFTASEIRVAQLLKDVQNYIKSNPRQVDWQKEDLSQIGYRIVFENQTRYVGKKIAEWSLALTPREQHYDRRITIATPLRKPGAYLLIAKMENGNTSRIIIWVDDTAIVQKNIANGVLFYVADAVDGHPLSGVNVEFFGYRRQWRNKIWGYRTEIENFAEYTGKNGQIILMQKAASKIAADDATIVSGREFRADMRWLAIARTESGRLAYWGFANVWYHRGVDQAYNQNKVFVITDRPVYRPGQTVNFKCWIRKAQYDLGDVSAYAGSRFTIRIRDSKNEKQYEKKMQADEWGGVAGVCDLAVDAALGTYRLEVEGYGSGRFRVEEYKKPEFQVSVDAPSLPVKLGDLIPAKVTAKYYFGGAVTEAKVKYKVLRYVHDVSWFPQGPWDWLYGNGYGWFAEDYPWYRGFFEWGCKKPLSWWWRRPSPPPELVVENEVPIGKDGTVTIPIDTLPTKELHGDQDHRYVITAEVTDLSRRTIVGSGSVIAARSPFKVHVWVDKGYYRVGDTIDAGFSVRTPDGRPVKGKGEVKLLRIAYDANRNPVETPVQTWKIDIAVDGAAHRQATATRAGQYRFSCTVTDENGDRQEGGYVFLVQGKGIDGNSFRFNALELVCDKASYAPLETVKLMINTDRAASTVLLFVRPANGIYLPPKMIQMQGKSTVFEIRVTQKDMPNFFVEAMTIADGKVYSETREIIVPPVKRVLNLNVLANAEVYKPGEAAQIRVKLTDAHGDPFVGTTVMAVYDKAVEYISGGSNVPEIKSFFWKWRRRHTPRVDSSLKRFFHHLAKKKEISMQSLGVFGHLVVDEVQEGKDGMFKEGKLERSKVLRSRGKGIQQDFMMDAAAPSASGAMLAAKEMKKSGPPPGESVAEAEAELVAPKVRKEFADTAFWAADIVTDANGEAVVRFDMPENLTEWKIKAWAMGHGTRVGEGETTVVVTKKIMVRLQAPRFFVQKDNVMLSANVHNYLPDQKQIQVKIALDGPCLTLRDPAVKTLVVQPGEDRRVDWWVDVAQEGEAVVRMQALTDTESDAMEMRFPVDVHGMDKMVPFCGVIRPVAERGAIVFEVPAQRRAASSRLEIRYSPSLAAAMVDALPYLAAYPYGCTEQTLNRFLPTVITQNVLKRLGLNLKAIADNRAHLNAQEIGDQGERAKQWQRFKKNPVFDENEVAQMVRKGLDRLTAMQLTDGGWGWFAGWGAQAYPHTTAVVVQGLLLAQENGVAVVPSVLKDGLAWLESYQQQQIKCLQNGRVKERVHPWKQHADNLDALVYKVLSDARIDDEEMATFLYEDRKHLSVYGKTLIGQAYHIHNRIEWRDMMMQNIAQYLRDDDENQTAHLNLGNEGYWWNWYGSEIEAHAGYLKLLAWVEPENKTASRLVKYLLNNRKHATYWNSTRDTAYCIEAFADYLLVSGETQPDMTVALVLDGQKMKTIAITKDNLFSFDSNFVKTGAVLTTGKHTLEIVKKGKGPLYYNAYLSYFTLEDQIPAAGMEITVDRTYYKLEETAKSIKVSGARGQAADQHIEKYNRIPLKPLSYVKSGDLVEVELAIHSKNDYEYILFEDMKAAGFEPVEQRSGYTREGAYMELRDERIAFFVYLLTRGKHSIAYRLRAEIPGRFSALPTRCHAMYAPELRANSDEFKIRITD